MSYWRLHYHLVWATYERLPLITAENERLINQVVFAKGRELGLILHAVGGVEDHMHVAVSVPPTLSVSQCVKHLKGASARAVNLNSTNDKKFRWQEGYGALTVDETSLSRVIDYVQRQKEHHHGGSVQAMYEKLGGEVEAEG